MTPLTKKEKEKLLSRLFWDTNMIYSDLDQLIDEKLRTVEKIESQKFFSRLLASCDWYTLIRLVPPKELQLILSDPILDRLFPKELKGRYIYARDVLSRNAIPASG